MFNDGGFRADCIDHSACQHVSLFYFQGHVPFFFQIKRRYCRTSGNKRTAHFFDRLQRTFDSVKDIINNTGTQQHIHWRARAVNGIARFQTCCFLIDLNCGEPIVDPDDLTHKTGLSDIYHLHHREGTGAFNGNNRTVDAVNYVICCHCISSHPYSRFGYCQT